MAERDPGHAGDLIYLPFRVGFNRDLRNPGRAASNNKDIRLKAETRLIQRNRSGQTFKNGDAQIESGPWFNFFALPCDPQMQVYPLIRIHQMRH
jgi:hypothetical protein